MNKKEIFFLCRYSNMELQDNYSQESNLSLSRKVTGILSVIKEAGHGASIIVTDTGNIKKSQKKVFHKNDIKIIKPRKYDIKIRWINYFLNILSTTFEVYRLKKRDSIFISWDYLPDTIIPIIFNNLKKGNHIIDLEEKISNDPEANLFFKIFEKILIGKISNDYFASNKNLLPRKFNRALIMPGFFAEDLIEEEDVIKKIQDKCLNLKSKKTINVIFSGRFDSNRGIDQFISLAKKYKKNHSFSFEIFGFGNKKKKQEIDKIIKHHKNIKLFYEEKRSQLISHLINADVAFNYLSDENFILESFPSKIVEQINFCPVIMSNFKVVELESDRIVLFDSEDDAKKVLDNIHIHLETFKLKFIKDTKDKRFSKIFSIKNKSKEARYFFDA